MTNPDLPVVVIDQVGRFNATATLNMLADELAEAFGDHWWELPVERRDRWLDVAAVVRRKIDALDGAWREVPSRR